MASNATFVGANTADGPGRPAPIWIQWQTLCISSKRQRHSNLKLSSRRRDDVCCVRSSRWKHVCCLRSSKWKHVDLKKDLFLLQQQRIDLQEQQRHRILIHSVVECLIVQPGTPLWKRNKSPSTWTANHTQRQNAWKSNLRDNIWINDTNKDIY